MQMIIIRIQGGLGNQMFEYSVAKWLESKGKEVKLDISHYDIQFVGKSDVSHNGFELANLFSLSIPFSSIEDTMKLGDISRSPFQRIRRIIAGKKKTHYTSDRFHGRRWYYPELAEIDDGYLDGAWCSFRYAEQCEDVIRKEFTFKEELKGRNLDISTEMRNSNSVSIHIRHGDYLKLQKIYNILNPEYYFSGIDYIKKHVDNPVFYCFSDDIEWCKNVFGGQVKYVDWNTSNDSYVDMQLMSLCKHNILANSTFSMWGAWLNMNPNKIVVRPKKVFQNKEDEFEDMFPQSWVIL